MVYEDRDINAAYALNSYVWKLLQSNLGWSEADHEGGRPIIPSSQQPEFMASGKPFIIYGAADHSPGHLYVLKKESIAYNIYSTSLTEANSISSLLSTVFDRQDDAAADVNAHLGREHLEGGRAVQRGIYFTYIKTTMVEKAEPAEEEGGFVSSLIILEAGYVVEDPAIKLSSDFTYP